MNIGLFGGTFDPIHRGHLALARAARERCDLSRILFVLANVPPHKQCQPLSAFAHRYAMIALATQQEKDFSPSLLEAPEGPQVSSIRKEKNIEKPNFTIDTVRRLKRSFKKADRLFLLDRHDASPILRSGIKPRRCFVNASLWLPADQDFPWPMWLTPCRRVCGRGRK